MNAIQITKPGHFNLADIPIPEPGPNEIQIKVSAAGICGTDLHIFNGEYEATYPIIPGHEFSGTVTQIGNQVKYFSVGDRVTADPNIPCYRCAACKRGFVNQCENLQAIGVTQNGAFASYVVVPEGVVFPIGDLSFEEAAMIEPLACAAWGLKRVAVQPGDSVLIFGAGPMGCLVAQAVQGAGATEVTVVDQVAWRLEIIKDLGATHTILGANSGTIQPEFRPSGYEIVVDATGISSVLESTLNFVQPRGKIWVFGVVPPTETARFNPYEIFRKDLSIIGSFAVNQTFHEAIQMIQSGTVKVAPLISHKFPLEEFERALDVAQNAPNRMKVQLAIN
jgi:D-arabinitol dehydrogenase (NADP+)